MPFHSRSSTPSYKRVQPSFSGKIFYRGLKRPQPPPVPTYISGYKPSGSCIIFLLIVTYCFITWVSFRNPYSPVSYAQTQLKASISPISLLRNSSSSCLLHPSMFFKIFLRQGGSAETLNPNLRRRSTSQKSLLWKGRIDERRSKTSVYGRPWRLSFSCSFERYSVTV